MKKILLLITTVLVLCVPAFADDVPHFTSAPFTVTNSAGTISQDITEAQSGVFFFMRAYNSADTFMVYAISSDDTLTINYTDSVLGTVDKHYTRNTWTAYGNYFIMSLPRGNSVFGTGFTSNPSVTPFTLDDSFDEIAQAFASLSDNPSGGASVARFSVPCGNVAYFQVSTSQTVNFKSVYQILSRPFANSTYGYWSDSGQRFGVASSLPTSTTSFPLASQSALYWSPDPQSKNLLGLSKTGLASVSCSAEQWYAFYNPAYNSNNTDFTTMDITGATVSISGSFSAVKIYPLEQVVDYQNGAFVGSSNDGYTSYYDGTIGEDGNVTFTDQNGNAGTPSAGGQNLLAPNETYQSIIDKVVGLLQNIVSEIKNLFSFGYEAINDLAGLMSNFGRALSGLYSWLPSEVHAALISAVSIAIVIGVFKVFI